MTAEKVNTLLCLILQAETTATEQFFLVSFNQGLEFQRGKFGVVLYILCNIPSCFILLQCNFIVKPQSVRTKIIAKQLQNGTCKFVNS